MPQMAPLWWEILFFTFILSFIIMSTIIYHMTSIKSPSAERKKGEMKEMIWEW
uniref:ATP synthase complex subunit 8 n=1 Tax=Scoparipes salvazai TaxID=2575669 RepID=A0A4D6X1I8_9HEMI|nr:ATP synthase F0 subunit 8 [Scoparipes salvazai]QCI09212.1 ATP synthase F0 subunit 8 [Scoparipes salvazai]